MVSPVSFADVSITRQRRGGRRSASTVHELDKKLTTRASANEEWNKSQSSRNLWLDTTLDDESLSADEDQNDSLVSSSCTKK